MNDQFTAVVENALDFLERSVSELSERPKYSVINFYTAIELLLKARLIKEHWSLVVMKPDLADYDKFLAGDFVSVGLVEAGARLDKIVKDGLKKEEIDCFNMLRVERNKAVHFAHQALSMKGGERALERIVSDHARGWLYLRRILMHRWVLYFSDFCDSIRDLDSRMREQARSLGDRFLLLTDELREDRERGLVYVDCPSCHFCSFGGVETNSVGRVECLTCRHSTVAIMMVCLNDFCKKKIALADAYEACPHCEHQYNDEEVIDFILQSPVIRRTNPSDPDDTNQVGCHECGGPHSVLALGSEWFCTNCFSLIDESHIQKCEWCGEPWAYLPDETFLDGCKHCHGRLGQLENE